MALVMFTAGLLAPGFAGAEPSPPPGAGAEQGKREEVKQQRSKVVSQIDLLKASDVELQVEVNRLVNLVRTQEEKVAVARLGLLDLESKLGGLAEEVEQGKRDAEVARHRAAARAVDAYMHPGVETMAAILEARDYDQAHRRRTLIGEVGRNDRAILQGHLDAQAALTNRQGRLSEAQQRADELRREQEDALADVRAAQATQVEAKRVLETRIREFQSEAEALAAAEGNLTAVIKQREAEMRTKGATGGELASAPGTAAPSGASSTTGAPATTPGTTAAPAPPPGGSPAVTTAPPPPRPAPTTAPPTTARPAPGARLGWPLSGPLTSPFGTRWGRLHAGIDIGVPIGTPIHASASGTVFFCGVMGGYGNVVLIDHGNGLVTLYGHQNNLACSNGQRVGSGQVIGYSGNTGHSTGPHLHFEVRRNGTAVDPMQYLG